MQAAKIIPFQPKEVRMADLDDGYTRIANDLYDALIEADLTKHQQKVAHAVVRLTYGYNKKNDRIADIQIAERVNLPRCKVNIAKGELLEMKVLIMDGKKIGINKNISEWNISKCYQNSNRIQNGNKVTETVTKSVTETVISELPKTEHTKDIIPKTKENNISTDGEQKKQLQNKIDFDLVMDAFNDAVEDKFPKVKKITPARQNAVKKLLKEFDEPTFQNLANYFYDFVDNAKPFYSGDNDRKWVADFDYIVRPATYLKVLEGSL